MFRSTTPLLCGIAALFGTLVLAGVAGAQNPRQKNYVNQGQTGVHQMEILNGPSRIVRNFGTSLSPGESAALKELERLENEAAYAQDLLTLKRQYVQSERLFEPHRLNMQLDLYGRSVTTNGFSSAVIAGGYGNGFGNGFAGYPYYRTGGYGFGSPGAVASGGSNYSQNLSLANGVGDEGVLKNTLAAVIGQQATPTYAASVSRDYERVSTLASASRRLQVGLRLPTLDTIRAENRAVADAESALAKPGVVTLTLKGGDKIRGTKLHEDKDWVTIDLIGGGTSRVRQSEVMRIDLPSTGGIVPAAGS